MGIFDWFRKTPPVNYHRDNDLCWISEEMKFKKIVSFVQLAQEQGKRVYVVCQFEEAFLQLKQIFEQIPIIFAHSLQAEPEPRQTLIYLAYADKLLQGKSLPINPADFMLITEHHPWLAQDQTLLAWIDAYAPGVWVQFYAGLDEPLFSLFNGERLQTLMKQMGLVEDESISHSFIDSAIANAQKKIAQKLSTKTPTQAVSAQKWIEKNLNS
ncbi:MAG TPA: hypothetical protein DCM08_05550 [Microscillaceae bacterium]|jgi:hypothetical protein|nr:hypothetical protein [Microscillaceae bacterium]